MTLRFLCASVLAAGIGGAAMAQTLHVPGDYGTIGEAIAAWTPGAEIVVADGTYQGAIHVYKPVHIRSANGPEVTTLLGHTTSLAVQYVAAGQGIIDGFTITGGGHGIRIDGGAPIVRNSILAGNRTGAGGGAYVRGGSPMFENCLFEDNDAMGAYGGGAFVEGPASAVFVNCRFFRNITYFGGGGATGLYGAPMTFINCLFVGNDSVLAGGAIHSTGPLAVHGCTFAGNAAEPGGAIYEVDDVARISNSVVCLNGPDQVAAGGTGSFEIVYTNIEQAGYEGNGNINVDPRFVDELGADGLPWTGDEDVRLGVHSPCIDAGSNAEIPSDVTDLDRDGSTTEPIPFDLDGLSRRLDDVGHPDTGLGDAPIVDMGAFERPDVSVCVGDIDGDGDVDFVDLLTLLSQWGECAGCPSDLNGDGDVGFLDLITLLAAWGCT